jgi:hypothetical protein
MKRRPPKVMATMVGTLRGRVVACGPYSALPFNPYRHPQWKPFRVSFNGKWHTVQVTSFNEDWGWEAESVEALEKDAENSPRVEIRGPA